MNNTSIFKGITIEWDFVEWIEKWANHAWLTGIGSNDVEYTCSGIWVDGELMYEAEDIEEIK